MFGKPPEVVPDNLNARQYFELSLWYEEKQMTNQARQACKKALAKNPEEPLASECRRFLNVQVPFNEIPQEGVDRFRRMASQFITNPGDGKRAAEKIIADYPDFEWPYRSLADLHLRRSDVKSCMEMLEKALAINPDYTPAVALMARAHTIDMNYESATVCLRRALADMPDDDDLRRLQRSLDFLMSLDD